MARPWLPLIYSLGLQPPSSPIGLSLSLLFIEAIAYFITILSSSIDSLCDLYSACLLPTVHLGNTASHSNRSYPFWVVAGWQPAQAFFTILHFYLRRSRTLQRSRYTRDVWDRICCLIVNWNMDYILYLHLG